MRKFFGKKSWDELREIGWTTFEFDGTDDSLLEIACSLGIPVPAKRNDSLIQPLTPRYGTLGSTKTFSAIFGVGSFPLHTDPELYFAGIGGQSTRSIRYDPIEYYGEYNIGEEYNNE